MSRKSTNLELGKKIQVRIRKPESDKLKQHMTADKNNEQFAFAFGKIEQAAKGSILTINQLLIPSKSDLKTQNSCAVTPSREFQDFAYFIALQTGQVLFEIHNHPGKDDPVFSSVDDHHGTKNAKAIARIFPNPITLVMIVANNNFDRFDGIVFDRNESKFRQVDRLEILGRPSEIHELGRDDPTTSTESLEIYDRQLLVPGWNQIGAANQRIGIIGVGGNGAHVVNTLGCMGAASRGGWILVDHDLIESSNLPRIPYALPAKDIGRAKVDVAAEFIKSKNQNVNVDKLNAKVDDSEAQELLKTATVLFGCVDNDGARVTLNELAVRYGIPLIDLGCDVQLIDGRMVAGGNVRAILPGMNACLVCCGGFDPSLASADLMDDEANERQASHGYVRDPELQGTPSIATLNAMTAQIAIAQFQALVNGEQFGDWDFVNFDHSMRFISAKSTQRSDCPCCGDEGFLGQGAADELSNKSDPVTLELFSNDENTQHPPVSTD